MLDPAKSTANPVGLLAPSPAQPAADPRTLPPGLAREPETHEPLYSIRVADRPGTVCAACGMQETGAGPVGYLGDEPICDFCLLERSADLGLVLAVIAVVRAYAGAGGTPEQHQQALAELGAFARIYHRAASKSWPVRMFHIPGFTDPRDASH